MLPDYVWFILGLLSLILAKPMGDFLERGLCHLDRAFYRYLDRKFEGKSIYLDEKLEKFLKD